MTFESIPSAPERPKEKMGRLMAQLAEKVNAELGEEILSPDASIDLEKWSDVHGEEEIDDDKRMIRNKRLMWSAATNDNTRDFYKKQNHWDCEGEELTQKIVGRYLENRESSNPALLEKAVTVIFHKILGDKYLVARSSVHDDYENGVDNVIVNKETGEVICAFDEVHGETKHGRIDDKKHKIARKAQAGGAKIKYGLTFEEGGQKLVKKEIADVPTFYLSMEPHALLKLLSELSPDLDAPPSRAELEVFGQFIASLKEQADFLSQERIPPQIKKNIDAFKRTLAGFVIAKNGN